VAAHRFASDSKNRIFAHPPSHSMILPKGR